MHEFFFLQAEDGIGDVAVTGVQTCALPISVPSVYMQVRPASICGTDLHIYGWDRWSQGRIKPPLTLGHEFCGNVERVGDEVTAVKPGDFVSAEMHVNCGHCRQCRLGQAHICQNLRIIGIDQDGAFADFVRIPASNIIKLDPGIPEHYGAILDPLGNENRSEEHTSELQSRLHLVCRLLLEKKK